MQFWQYDGAIFRRLGTKFFYGTLPQRINVDSLNTHFQIDVFDQAAKRAVSGVLDGINGTVFAYGQTGSGEYVNIDNQDVRGHH